MKIDVSTESLARVLETLGDIYRVNPQLLRPNDKLKDFFDLDSWSLGIGTEKLNKWLAEEGFTDVNPTPTTILDLVLLLEDRKLQSSTSLPLSN